MVNVNCWLLWLPASVILAGPAVVVLMLLDYFWKGWRGWKYYLLVGALAVVLAIVLMGIGETRAVGEYLWLVLIALTVILASPVVVMMLLDYFSKGWRGWKYYLLVVGLAVVLDTILFAMFVVTRH